MATAMDLAYGLCWKPMGNRPSNYRWEHPTHGVLHGPGLRGEAPWRWRRVGKPDQEFPSLRSALEAIHGAIAMRDL